MANTIEQRNELLVALKGILDLNEDLELLEFELEDEYEWGFIEYYNNNTDELVSFIVDEDEKHFIKMYIDGELQPLPTVEKVEERG